MAYLEEIDKSVQETLRQVEPEHSATFRYDPGLPMRLQKRTLEDLLALVSQVKELCLLVGQLDARVAELERKKATPKIGPSLEPKAPAHSSRG